MTKLRLIGTAMLALMLRRQWPSISRITTAAAVSCLLTLPFRARLGLVWLSFGLRRPVRGWLLSRERLRRRWRSSHRLIASGGSPDENTCRQIAERTDDGEGLLFSLSRNVVNAKQAYRTYIYIVIDGAGTLHGEQGIYGHGADSAPDRQEHDGPSDGGSAQGPC